jgi:hypothetical protein
VNPLEYARDWAGEGAEGEVVDWAGVEVKEGCAVELLATGVEAEAEPSEGDVVDNDADVLGPAPGDDA